MYFPLKFTHLVAGATNNGGEDSPGGVITGETGFAHAGAIVNDKSSNVFVTHVVEMELTVWETRSEAWTSWETSVLCRTLGHSLYIWGKMGDGPRRSCTIPQKERKLTSGKRKHVRSDTQDNVQDDQIWSKCKKLRFAGTFWTTLLNTIIRKWKGAWITTIKIKCFPIVSPISVTPICM